jgi:hypothetical protein
MGSLNRKRTMNSNDVSSAIVMKRLLRKCMNVLEKDCGKHEWNCDCNKCVVLREITKEI